MLLTRIAVAVALLFGISCQSQDDLEFGTDQGLAPVVADDQLSHESDEPLLPMESDREVAVDDAEVFIDDTEVAIDESVATLDEESSSSSCKWKCTCCYYEDDEEVEDECYSAKAKKKHKAMDKCMDKCEAHHEPDGGYDVEHDGEHDGECLPKDECEEYCDD